MGDRTRFADGPPLRFSKLDHSTFRPDGFEGQLPGGILTTRFKNQAIATVCCGGNVRRARSERGRKVGSVGDRINDIDRAEAHRAQNYNCAKTDRARAEYKRLAGIQDALRQADTTRGRSDRIEK